MSKNYEDVQNAFVDICQSCGKHMVNLMNLNMQAFQKLSKLDGVQDLLNAKQPADLTKAQSKLFSEMGGEVNDYQQKVFNLVVESQKEIADKISEMTKDFSNKQSSASQKAAKAA